MNLPTSLNPQEHNPDSSWPPSALAAPSPAREEIFEISGIEFTVAKFKKWDGSDHVSVVGLNRDKRADIGALMIVVDGDQYNQDVQLYLIGRDNQAILESLTAAKVAVDAYTRLHLPDGHDNRDDTAHLALLAKDLITSASQVRNYFESNDPGIEAVRIFSTGGGDLSVEKLKDTLRKVSTLLSNEPDIAASLVTFVLNFFQADRQELKIQPTQSRITPLSRSLASSSE